MNPILGRAALLVALLAAALPAVLPAAAATSAAGPQPGSPEYLQRDAQNIADAYGRQTAADGQFSADFIAAAVREQGPLWVDQMLAQAASPTRPAAAPGQLVPGWNSGNPYRANWSGTRGLMLPVSFTNRYGAQLLGDVFAPLPGARDPYTGKELRAPYPGVVLTTGSVQGSERMYWWLAQDLAERGYVVLTYDVQGQGRSETLGHQGPVQELPFCTPGSPLPGEIGPCPGVPFQQTANFVYGTQDAIDFFVSTPSARYRNPQAGGARVNAYNPLWKLFDRSVDRRTATAGRTLRLGLVGHSLGATAVSYVQGVDRRVAAVVALDKLASTAAFGGQTFEPQGPLRPVVPGLGVQSEYGFNVAPYFANGGLGFGPPTSPQQAPDVRRELKSGYDGWRKAGVDTMVIVPRASTHLEYTDIPWALPASRYGQDVASHYAQAWFDKYLKHDRAADARLLGTSLRYLEPTPSGTWRPVTLKRAERLSFYYCSAMSFRSAAGRAVLDKDIARVGC